MKQTIGTRLQEDLNSAARLTSTASRARSRNLSKEKSLGGGLAAMAIYAAIAPVSVDGDLVGQRLRTVVIHGGKLKFSSIDNTNKGLLPVAVMLKRNGEKSEA